MLKLTISHGDGSHYWTEYFNSADTQQAWLKEEMTRPYWKQDFTVAVDVIPEVTNEPTEQEKTQQELKRQQMLARVNALSPLVGKSLSQGEIKQAVEILLAILLNGESTLAIELLKLRSSN